MKDTREAFLAKIDPFLNVLRAWEEWTNNCKGVKDNDRMVYMRCLLFYSVLWFLYKEVICNSFLNVDVIVALIYKVMIVALIREKRKKKKFQTRGGKTTLRYTYKYIYVTLRYIKVPLCNNMYH